MFFFVKCLLLPQYTLVKNQQFIKSEFFIGEIENAKNKGLLKNKLVMFTDSHLTQQKSGF